MILLAQDTWLTLVEDHGLALVLVAIGVYGLLWVGKRVFGAGGYSDRYVAATEDIVATLKEHLVTTDASLAAITTTSQTVATVCEKLDRNQAEMCNVIQGLVGNCEHTHGQILGDLSEQTAAIQGKIDAMREHFAASQVHHDQQDRLVAAVDGCIDVLEIACPDKTTAIEALRRTLRGEP